MSKKRKVVKDEPFLTTGMLQHIKYLIGLSLLAKIAIYIFSVYIIGAGMDMFAINYYYEHAVSIFQGRYPYINYYYEYPILIFIPVFIALLPSLLLHNLVIFFVTFSILMILFDFIIVICVYLIARKIWNNSKIAFIAGFIYLSAICASYFVMVSYDAFPTCLFMIGLTMLFYGKDLVVHFKLNEYSMETFGYFAKVFPALSLPFIVLYKSRSTSLKQEIISAAKIIIPISVVLFIPTFILNPSSTFKTYFPARMDIGYFPNTIYWTLHVWLHDVIKLDITVDSILIISYLCMGVGFIILFYSAYKYKQQDPTMLLKFILVSVMLMVMLSKVRSPGYIVWFTPLLCILVADNVYKIGLFYIFQILAFVEFPVTFWLLWTNVGYTQPIYSSGWYTALGLFTLEFSILLILIWFVIDPIKSYKQIFKPFSEQ